MPAEGCGLVGQRYAAAAQLVHEPDEAASGRRQPIAEIMAECWASQAFCRRIIWRWRTPCSAARSPVVAPAA